MPERPSARHARTAATSGPRAVTAPSPVMATAAGTALPGALARDEVDEGVHRREGTPADLLVRYRNAETLLDQHHQLERVDRVEPEPLAENRRVVRDVAGVELEPEPLHQQLLHLRAQGRAVHDHPFRAS